MDQQTLAATQWSYTKTGKEQSKRIYQNTVDSKIITDETKIEDLSTIFLIHENDSVYYLFYDENDQERYKVNIFYQWSEKAFYAIIHEKKYDLASHPVAHIQYSRAIKIDDISQLSTQFIQKMILEIENTEGDRAVYIWYDLTSAERFIIDQSGCVTEKNYNLCGKLISHRQYAEVVANPEKLLGLNEYELAAHITRSCSDRTTYYIYDSAGFEIFHVNPNRAVTRYDYDENHNLIMTTLFKDLIEVPEAYDQLLEDLKSWIPQPERDSITQKFYDSANRVTIIVDALGNRDVYEYDTVGNNIKATNRANHVTYYHYDGAKRRVLEVYPEAPYTKVCRNAEGKLTADTTVISAKRYIQYDNIGNKSAIILGDGESAQRIIKSEYNANGQTIKTIMPDVEINDEKNIFNCEWQGLLKLPLKKQDLETCTIYDVKGNIIAEKNANNDWSYSLYDALNNLIFAVNYEGAITQYTYDNFGQITQEYRYAKPIQLEISEILLTPEQLLFKIQTDDNDRVKNFKYDKAGQLIEETLSRVFYYCRDEFGFAIPTTRKAYNTFGDCIWEAKSIRANVWAEKRKWYDGMKNVIAEVNENNYLTCYDFNSANKPIEIREYSEPFLIQPEYTKKSKELEEEIVTSSKDRIYRYTYDALHQKKTEALLAVITDRLVLDDKNIPTIQHNEKKDLIKTWFYSPTQKITLLTYEDGGEEHFFYDAADNIIAETEVSRYSQETLITPMKQFKIDVFGKTVVTTTSSKGGKIENSAPILLGDSPENFAEEMSLYDNRGLIQLKQDAEKNLKGFTYTSSRKVARQLQTSSNWKEMHDEEIFFREQYIDEKEFIYNRNDQPITTYLRRNGELKESTWNGYNVFGELVGEGPSQDILILYHRYDSSGFPWITNSEKGANTVILRDLRGIETLRLQAANDNLSEVSYKDLSNLFTWTPERLDFSETIHDEGGRVIAHKTPIWFSTRKAQPSRSYFHDRWNNVIREINSLGFQTDYEFNHKDKISLCMEPEVDAYLENMNKIRLRPTIVHAYNERGFEIGVVDANQHVTGYLLDAAGNCYQKILADGTICETTIFDGFNRPTRMIDARGKATEFTYNLKDQIVLQRLPSGKLFQYAYDEQDNRMSQSDSAGHIWRYNYDINSNVIARYMPLGQCIKMSYDRNRMKLSEINPDSSKLTWETDYFGNILQYTDLGGKILNHIYDFNQKLIQQLSQAGPPRKILRIDSKIDKDTDVAVYGHHFDEVPAVDVTYIYKYGLLEMVQDKSLNKITTYAYDSEQRRILSETKKMDGKWLNNIKTNYDELGRDLHTDDNHIEVSLYPSTISADWKYDAVGNIRARTHDLSAACYSPPKCKNILKSVSIYNTYDAADRIKILNGALNNGVIQAVKGSGLELKYDKGFRVEEVVPGTGYATLNYDEDGRLTRADSSNDMHTLREYHDGDWIKCYKETYGAKVTEHQYIFNANGWQLHDEYSENNVKKTVIDYLDFTDLGQHTRQIVDYQNGVKDTLTLTYLGLDHFVPNTSAGKRTDKKTTTNLGTVGFWYDPHGTINAKSSNTEDEPTYGTYTHSCPLLFDTTYEGLVLKKCYVNQSLSAVPEPSFMNKIQFFHYFHNVVGKIQGVYGYYYFSMYIPSHKHPDQYNPTITLPNPLSFNHPIALFFPTDKNKKMDPTWNVTPQDLIPTAPYTYIVNQGDTFNSIAKKMLGDFRYAGRIAAHNSMLNISAPKPGLLLKLPQVIPERNKFDTGPASPYHQFVEYITGSLYPHLQTSVARSVTHHHHHHGGFFKSLIKIVAVGLIIALAPALGGVLLSVAGIATASATATAIATGVAGAIADAAAQGLAIEMGVQSQFSFAEVLETGVSAVGALSCQGFPKTFFDAGKAAFRVGTVQVSTQLAEMAAGIRTKFDAKAIGLQIAASLASFQVSKALQNKDLLLKNMANVAVNSVLNRVIKNSSFNLENMAAQIAGGVMMDFSQSLIMNDPVMEEETKSLQQEIKTVTYPDFSAAERVATMALPDAKLDFQNVTTDDIRQSRIARWQTESANRSAWEDKHSTSQARHLAEQIQQSAVTQDKTFMDRVKDFNNTVESIFVKPALAMSNSIIQDANTLRYADNFASKIRAGGSLALDSALIFGIPELGAGKALASSLSKFGFWGETGKSVEKFSFKIGEDILHFQKHGVRIATKYNLGNQYNIRQYVQDANQIIKEGIFVPELNGYVKIPSNSGEAHAPFVGIDRMTNEITTFHIKPISFFEKNASSLGWTAKRSSEKTDLIGPNRELGWKYPYRKNL